MSALPFLPYFPPESATDSLRTLPGFSSPSKMTAAKKSSTATSKAKTTSGKSHTASHPSWIDMIKVGPGDPPDVSLVDSENSLSNKFPSLRNVSFLIPTMPVLELVGLPSRRFEAVHATPEFVLNSSSL